MAPDVDVLLFDPCASELFEFPSCNPCAITVCVFSPVPHRVAFIGVSIHSCAAESGKYAPHVLLGVNLTGHIVRTSEHPVAYGGFSDIWSCMCQWWNQSPTRVAVKAIRPVVVDNDDYLAKQKAFKRELSIWARLKHHNILPLYGVTDGFGPLPAFVSPWAENGTLTEYLEHREQLDLERRLALLAGVSAGICYLHSQKVVHGDLSGSNVLISGDGRACLSDFGLSTTSQEVSDASQTPSFPVNIRWVAPELLLEQEEGTPTSCFPSQETDIYSFGSIMFQVLTGKFPFHDIRRVAQIVLLVSRGQRPQRELGWDGEVIPDVLWDFMERCWQSPSERPSSGEVVQFIESVS